MDSLSINEKIVAAELEVDKRPTLGCQTRVTTRGEYVRKFIVDNVGKHPSDINSVTALHCKITRQAANKHLRRLVVEKALLENGKTRHKSYRLAPLFTWMRNYPITKDLAEDQIWSRDVSLALNTLPQNVQNIWHYCFTEMFNNAIDHSGGSEIFVRIAKTAATTQIMLKDNGVGIFRKIQSELGLLDERHAILELAKGKLTTDPTRHTGQGIFFSSRMVDSFDILAGGAFFTHQFGAENDWILEVPESTHGTAVFMKLNNHSSRSDAQIFRQYSSDDGYDFTKTVIPVRLAQYGEDKLISRSQAKRLLSRVDLFKVVVFDFKEVESIGQAFADEIFRVFERSHPDIELTAIHANPGIQQIIHSARNLWDT